MSNRNTDNEFAALVGWSFFCMVIGFFLGLAIGIVL